MFATTGHGLSLVLTPYWYGAGSPQSTLAEARKGLDCSGLYGFLARTAGLVGVSCPDMSAAAWADSMDPVPADQTVEGDAAIYPGHIAWVVGRGDEGNVVILGANGGRSSTKGDNPEAYVRCEYDGDYRGDLTCYGRLKKSFRDTTGKLAPETVAVSMVSQTLLRLLSKNSGRLEGLDWTNLRWAAFAAGQTDAGRSMDGIISRWLWLRCTEGT